MDRWKSTSRKKPRHGESQKSEGRRSEGKDQTGRKSEERRCRCAKGGKAAKFCVFSNDLWLRMVAFGEVRKQWEGDKMEVKLFKKEGQIKAHGAWENSG